MFDVRALPRVGHVAQRLEQGTCQMLFFRFEPLYIRQFQK
jgi:hypothetical protein